MREVINKNVSWVCPICLKIVNEMTVYDDDTGLPMYTCPQSRYWKAEPLTVYCSPACSLKDHENSI